MAAPIAGGPVTLGDYLDWAEEEGCAVDFAVARNKMDGVTVPLVKIVTPDGARATIVGKSRSDTLHPTDIYLYDLRLDLESPFPSQPPAVPWPR